MTSNTLRTIDELRVLYALHPAIRDVYVEGRTDARFFSWYLKEKGFNDVVVYAVDDRVEVPGDLVRALDMDVNARGRATALASEAAAWGTLSDSLTAIIDADFDWLHETGLASWPTLLRTDFPALEGYGLLEGPLTKFLTLHTQSDRGAVNELGRLGHAWTALFCIRFHLHKLGVAIVPNYVRCCAEEGGAVIVDVSEIVRRSVSGIRMDEGPLVEAIEASLFEVESKFAFAARGHDIAPLLREYVALTPSSASVEVVEALLLTCIESTHIDEMPLFVALRARATAAAS